MAAANLVVTLHDGAAIPAAKLLAATGQSDLASALEELAAAILANPLWKQLPGATLIGRCEPVALLAVAGTFTDAQQALLGHLQSQLELLLNERDIVDYQQAEEVCGVLADRLLAAFGKEALYAAQFAPIPRGGLIVLGMLAYHLDLRPGQLTTLEAASPDKTLFVVDDCSLSGTRFRESLGRTAPDAVVFCPLYAPEALCAAIVASEPHVVACLAGANLDDMSPAPGDEGYEAWHEQRLSRLVDDPYWMGQPLGVAFAWCAPQTRLWDETEGCFVEGWSVVPPSRCLKRRVLQKHLESDADAKAMLPRLVVNAPRLEAHVRAGDRVLWCDQGDGAGGVLLANIPQEEIQSGPVHALVGISAEFWKLLMTNGSVGAAIEILAEQYQVARERLEADMNALEDQLLAEGLLVLSDPAPLVSGSRA